MTTSMVADKNCLLPDDLFPFADEDITQATTNATEEDAAKWREEIAKWEPEKPLPLVTCALISFAKTTLEPHTTDPTARAIRIVANVIETREKEK